jgi:DNA replication protein DnaC
MTSKCPYGECDGSGITWLQNIKTLETKARYCKCRKEMIQAKRIEFANIPDEFKNLTVRSFSTDIYTSKESQSRAIAAKKITVNYIKKFKEFEEKAKGLYYYSKTKGSGKTRLALSLGNALLNSEHRQVRFITTLSLLQEIKSTYNQESQYTESQLVEAISNVHILIIDDIGVEKPTKWVNEILYSIFDTRMKYNRITIFTSNCAMEDLQHDDRLKSRIFKMAIPVKMPEEDIRIQQSKQENEQLQNILLK